MSDKIKILYIDDYELDRELVKDSLEKEHGGFEVKEASNKTEFESLLKAHVFDVILSDFNIAGFEGLQVIELVRLHDPKIPVIIVTGTGSEEIAAKALKKGASDYVIKRPQHIQKLPQTILAAIEKRILRDEREKAEKSRDEALQRLELALRSSDIGLWDWNLRTRALFVSREWKTQLGFQDDELEGNYETWENRLHPEDKDPTLKALQQYLDGKIPRYDVEFRLKHRDESYRWIHARGEAIYDKENKPYRILGCHVDITERKKLQTQLLRAQKAEALGALSAGIAHDFNNILSSVIGYAELSMMDAENGTQLYENLSEILNAGSRAKELVRQILTFSKQGECKLRPICIVSLVNDAIKMLRSMTASSIDIRFKSGGNEFTVNADPTQMHQIIVNLVTNAAQAMTAGQGIIEIAVDPVMVDESVRMQYPNLASGEYAKIMVADNGIGIPKDQLDYIFDPYFTTKMPDKGTGLGLSVVHGIVKAHKGHITVYSERNQGTTFHVYIPIAKASSQIATIENSGPLPGGLESILVIDDEPAITKLLKYHLEKSGYTITTSNNSREAVELFRSSPDKYDLVITDMTMPQITGVKLAQTIKMIRPETPVILCTGFSENINVHNAAQLNIDAFLMKPVEMAKMTKTVRKVLDEAKLGMGFRR